MFITVAYGLLFSCVRQARIDRGHGVLHIEWIKPHLKAEVAVSQGVCPVKWLANATVMSSLAELLSLPAVNLGSSP